MVEFLFLGFRQISGIGGVGGGSRQGPSDIVMVDLAFWDDSFEQHQS